MNKLFLKNCGNIKIQNYFLIKKLKKIKKHFLFNKKDLKCKIVISIIFSKLKKNIKYLKNKI